MKCSHTGYFSECYNDLYRRTKNDHPVAILTSGHFQYLTNIQQIPHMRDMSAIMNHVKTRAKVHICLPDNLVNKLGFDSEEMYTKFREYFKGDRATKLPYETFTISSLWEGHKRLIVVTNNGGASTATAFIKCSPKHLPDSPLPVFDVEKAKSDVAYVKKLVKSVEEEEFESNPEKVFDAISTCTSWSAYSFKLSLERRGWGVVPSLNRAYTPSVATLKEVKQIMSLLGSYVHLASLPSHVVEAYVDPSHNPQPITKKQRRQGIAAEPQATKLNILLPSQVKQSIRNPSGETGVHQKEHERSGHWRTYKSGKKIWINTYKAGDKDLGSNVTPPKKKVVEVFPRK